MENKLILNVAMNGAETYIPEKCIVEKVVDILGKYFDEIVEKRDSHDPFIQEYSDIMRTDSEGNHCVMFLNRNSGDGFLVQGNHDSGNFLSQYIPCAADILRAQEITQSEKDVHDFFRRKIDEFISKNSGEFEMPFDKFSDSLELCDTFEAFLDDMIMQNPSVDSTELKNNEIIITKKELVTTKLYCPLSVSCMDEDDYDYYEVSSSCLKNHVYEVNEFIEGYLEEEEKERGLIHWADNPRLDKIVRSVFPSVEIRSGDVYGVLTVESFGEIPESDMRDLIDEMTGQLSDGWGEGFEQQEITLDDEMYTISFWQCGGKFFLLPENEAFPEQGIKMSGV